MNQSLVRLHVIMHRFLDTSMDSAPCIPPSNSPCLSPDSRVSPSLSLGWNSDLAVATVMSCVNHVNTNVLCRCRVITITLTYNKPLHINRTLLKLHIYLFTDVLLEMV